MSESGSQPEGKGSSTTDEPTVVDLRSSPRKPEDTGDTSAGSSPRSAASGVTLQFDTRHGQSEVSAAVPMILRAEEHARSLGLFRLAGAAAVASLVAIWLPERVSQGDGCQR